MLDYPERDRMLMPPPSSTGSANRPESLSTRNANIVMSGAARSSSIGSSGPSSRKSSVSSETTKLRVKEIDGDECWACGSSSPQICHVFAQEDQQAGIWCELGLLDFPLASAMNAIPLCPTCHQQFDCALDPGTASAGRQQLRGIVLKREVPDSKMYKQHQVDKGIITSDAIGGQYRPTFLKSYLHHSRLSFDIAEYLSVPREWHGAPLACLRRCIHLLGSPRLSDKQTRLKLEQLRDLYFFDKGGDSLPLCDQSVMQIESDDGREKHGEKKRRLDENMPSEPQSTKKQRGTQQGDSENSYNRNATTFCPILQREVRAYWSLEPECSAEEAVRQFAPVITRSFNSTHV